MKSCDDEGHREIKTIRRKTEESNMVKFRKCCIGTNYGMIDRPVREASRMTDAIESDNTYLLDFFPGHYDQIDKEARNVFSNGLIAAAIKC